MTSYIGWWWLHPTGKAHYIESEVTDRLVMHCGRQMRFHLDERMAFQKSEDPSRIPFALGRTCKQCVHPLLMAQGRDA